MSNYAAGWRNLVKAVALPIVGLGFCYAVVIDQPLRKKCDSLKAKQTRLVSAVERGTTEHAAHLKKLAEIQKALRAATTLVATPASTVEETASEVTTRSLDKSSSLSELSSTLAMFSRHEVICLASQFDSPQAEFEPSVRTTGKKAAQASSSPIKRGANDQSMVRFTFQGRFANMLAAILDLEASNSRFNVASLEMETASADDANHRWTLVLKVRM